MPFNTSLPDGTQETVDQCRDRIRTLERALMTIRADILDGLRDYDERAEDPTHDPQTLMEEFATEAREFLTSTASLIVSYVGDRLPLR